MFMFILEIFSASGQHSNTVGLIAKHSEREGYVLFAPMNHNTTYLINRSGHLVHSWDSDYVPGLSAYLGSDGSLFRAGRDLEATYINSGGAGGIIERYNWEGELVWKYRYSDKLVRQHHDFEVMPNGNVLLIAWELKTKEEAIAAGRDPASMGARKLWPDHLVEVAPEGFDKGRIVWQWHVWDHLIQDYDDELPNFGKVDEHPERININFRENGSADWIHANSVEYLAELDLIALSSRAFNEIWIIDHSTTSAEAATSRGGQYGRGGDLLFRWGNPQTYAADGATEQILYGQHGMHWVMDEDGRNQLFIFNNQNRRPATGDATIEVLSMEPDTSNSNAIDRPFPLSETHWSWKVSDGIDLFAPLFSNVQQIDSSSLLLCLGPRGTFLEIHQGGEIQWQYISPVTEFGTILNQGETIGDRFSSNNAVFGATYYHPDHPAFTSKTLSPKGTIEGESTTSVTVQATRQWRPYPNPVDRYLSVPEKLIPADIQLVDMQGKPVPVRLMDGSLDLSAVLPGSYLLSIRNYGTFKIMII